MAHCLLTATGKKLYALRKQTPEPVFGIIKSVMGFRQFLLRGLDASWRDWRQDQAEPQPGAAVDSRPQRRSSRSIRSAVTASRPASSTSCTT
jgi:hypothetical protein